MKNKKTILSEPSTDTDQKYILQRLYQKFCVGQRVEKEIRIEYYQLLNLTIDQSFIELARQTRISRLSGSNEYIELKLLDAYQHPSQKTKSLIDNDKELVNKMAAKLIVIEYFNACNKKGLLKLFET